MTKRTKHAALETELTRLTGVLPDPEDAPIRSLRRSSPSKTPTKAAAPVVVTLPTVSTRKAKAPSTVPEAVTGRQEANVLSRVAQLQKDGLWIDKKLAKLPDPTTGRATFSHKYISSTRTSS